MQKKWCIDSNDKRFLVKGNYGNQFQQSINEVFASQIHEMLGFDNYTKYRLTKIKWENEAEGIGCACD